MSDLIERLNQASNKNRHTSIGVLWNLCDEAADEIERLRVLLDSYEAMEKSMKQEAKHVRF